MLNGTFFLPLFEWRITQCALLPRCMHSPGLGECLNAVSEVNLLLWRYLYGGITRGAAAIFIDGRRPVVSKIYLNAVGKASHRWVSKMHPKPTYLRSKWDWSKDQSHFAFIAVPLFGRFTPATPSLTRSKQLTTKFRDSSLSRPYAKKGRF